MAKKKCKATAVRAVAPPPVPEPPNFTETQEDEFLSSIVGLKVTGAHFCACHGYCFEFDDRIQMVLHEGCATWLKRAVQ
jgi:hypothetical protein